MNTARHIVDTESVAQAIREDRYFSDARRWYDVIYHGPLMERCLLAVISLLAFANTAMAVLALVALFPLAPVVPFTITSKNVFRDLPLIRHLAVSGEDANVALMRYFAANYVIRRESYNVDALGRDYNNTRQHSSDTVFSSYQQVMDPQNPASPVARYERHTVRDVAVLHTELNTAATPFTARVEFLAVERRGKEERRSRWTSDLTFRYSNIVLDQATSKVTPMQFEVTGYSVAPAKPENEVP